MNHAHLPVGKPLHCLDVGEGRRVRERVDDLAVEGGLGGAKLAAALPAFSGLDAVKEVPGSLHLHGMCNTAVAN